MKKIFPILIAALTLTTSINATSKPQNNISTSIIADDDRDVKDFNGVAGGGPIDVIITLGDTESCRFEGDAEAISTLVTEVKGHILIIRPKTSWTSWAKKYENKKITAHVTAKAINSLTMSGSGSIVVNGLVNFGDLATTLSGSGSIKVTTNADNFTNVITGSGTVYLSGDAEKANIILSGSGNFAGKNFSVSELSTKISGSGTVNIKADVKIKALIVGSGTIKYSGDADVDKSVIGSGKVIKI